MDEDKVLAAIAALSVELGGLRADLRAELQRGLDEVRGEVAGLRTVVMGKLKQMQDELTALRSDLAVTSFSAMRGVRRTEGDREDMRDLSEMVNKMWTSMLRMKTDIGELQRRA